MTSKGSGLIPSPEKRSFGRHLRTVALGFRPFRDIGLLRISFVAGEFFKFELSPFIQIPAYDATDDVVIVPWWEHENPEALLSLCEPLKEFWDDGPCGSFTVFFVDNRGREFGLVSGDEPL